MIFLLSEPAYTYLVLSVLCVQEETLNLAVKDVSHACSNHVFMYQNL